MSQMKQAQAGWLRRSIENAKTELNDEWTSRVRQNLKPTASYETPKPKAATR
jgi:hypothetical protein